MLKFCQFHDAICIVLNRTRIFMFAIQIDIVVVDEQKGETIEGVDIETMMKPFYGDINLRTSQQRVCMELLKGRHDQSAAKPRYDVFYAAPCGFGKSLCFVAMATLFRGITVCCLS